MSETILLPGGRDARGTLDRASDAGAADACVVACPPHPQHRGHRGDQRLRAASDELGERGIDCLRFDYGPWDGGRGERSDALEAVAWARQRYDRVALFGFSFGGAVALSAAARGADVAAVSALAPPARLGAERDDSEAESGEGDASESDIGGGAGRSPAGCRASLGNVDAVADLDGIPDSVPIQVVYGARDDVANVGPVAERARERGHAVVELPADHFFVGQSEKVAVAVADFLVPALSSPD